MPHPDGFDVVERHRKGSIKKMCRNPVLGLLVKDGRKRACGECVRGALVENCIVATHRAYDVYYWHDDRTEINQLQHFYENIGVNLDDLDMFDEEADKMDGTVLHTELDDLCDRIWENETLTNMDLKGEMRAAGVHTSVPSSTRYLRLKVHARKARHDVAMGMWD